MDGEAHGALDPHHSLKGTDVNVQVGGTTVGVALSWLGFELKRVEKRLPRRNEDRMVADLSNRNQDRPVGISGELMKPLQEDIKPIVVPHRSNLQPLVLNTSTTINCGTYQFCDFNHTPSLPPAPGSGNDEA